MTVSVNSENKCRLILDLRHVNKFLPKFKFKLEDTRVFINYLHLDGFMFNIDMKSEYHHINIHPEFFKFLGFQWPLNDSPIPRYFAFTVLPFGIATAPHLFTKLFRPLVRHWRSKGIPLVLYLDDGVACLPTIEQAEQASGIVKRDLSDAGVVCNDEKSVWPPRQVLEWLGIVWNLSSNHISIPDRRIASLENSLVSIKSQFPLVTPRKIASVTGKIVSLAPVVGNILFLMSKCLQSFVNFHDGDWDFALDFASYQYFTECVKEIDFWIKNCRSLNRRAFVKYSIPATIAYSDASAASCGGCILQVDSEEFELFYKAFSKSSSFFIKPFRPWRSIWTVMLENCLLFYTVFGRSGLF